MEKQIDTRATIEKSKETARQKQIEEERRLNCKINFFVMREVWNTIRGRATKAMEINRTIYETLDIRRERYIRVMDIGVIRLTKDELKDLVNKTGVEKAIFEGKKTFGLEKITRKEWKELFELRAEDIKEFNKVKPDIAKLATKDDLKKGTNLYKLLMYFQTVPTRLFSLGDVVSRLEGIDFSQLDSCEMEILERYLNVLREQAHMAETIVRYKNLKTGQ